MNKSAQCSMTHGSICTGIGGFDLAAHWAGMRNLWQVEKDLFCRALNKYNYPDAIQFLSIEKFLKHLKSGGKIDYTDIVSAGLPCQPYSSVGEGKGTKDDRHLWPIAFECIKRIRPRWIIIENVVRFANMVAGQVLSDLESIEYIFPKDIKGNPIIPVIPAAAVNADHIRQRIWIIAYARGAGLEGIHTQRNRESLQLFEEFIPRYIGQATPKILRTYNGFPDGMDRIKALGNAIVPQIAYVIFNAILSIEGRIK